MAIPYPPVLDLNRTNTCLYYDNENLLNQIKWKFTSHYYISLVNFSVDVQKYNQEIDNELEDFMPFATIFSSSKVKLMYQAEIQSEDDLLENEVLLDDNDLISKKSEEGYYNVHILATITSDKKYSFGSLHLLFQMHNTLYNKRLNNGGCFGGLELLGNEEDGTPVVYLRLEEHE